LYFPDIGQDVDISPASTYAFMKKVAEMVKCKLRLHIANLKKEIEQKKTLNKKTKDKFNVRDLNKVQIQIPKNTPVST
jgi:hypothetical protein